MIVSLQRFWLYIWPQNYPAARIRLILALICLVISKSFLILSPLAFKEIVDSLTQPNASKNIIWFVLLYGLARLGSVMFAEIRDLVFIQLSERAVRMLALHTFRHLHHLSLKFHMDRQTGALIRIMERAIKAVETMLTFLSINFIPTFVEIILVSFILAYLYTYTITLTVLLAMICYIIFTIRITMWRIEFVKAMNESNNLSQTHAIDSLLNFETVKYFSNEEAEAKRYDESLVRYEKDSIRSKQTLSILNVGQSVIITLSLCLNLYFTYQGICDGSMTVGDMIAINTFLIQLYIPLFNLGFAYREIKTGLVNLESLFNLIDEPIEIKDLPHAIDDPIVKGAITFKKVNFGYAPSRSILTNLSFNIPAGKTLAVVGESGAGKSTLTRLLYRFYDVNEGEILIDGINIKDRTLYSLRQAIGIVPQDCILFNESIYYNIAYGNMKANQGQIMEAAQKAHIYDFIMRLPQQFDTVVGERGLKLSGGEKQRIAIARTLLKNPKILILDEATSALDSNTEKEIQSNLNELSKGRTTLMIAHRLSTITHADKIIVLHNGQIIEEGTHEELLGLNKHYKELWLKQQEQEKDKMKVE